MQDSLLPFEKRAVELTFAPTFVPSGSGWDHFQATPTRRDYTLFIRFMAITNRDKKRTYLVHAYMYRFLCSFRVMYTYTGKHLSEKVSV